MLYVRILLMAIQHYAKKFVSDLRRMVFPGELQEQTTQWSKEKVQKDKQRSTKHTYKTKDRVTRTPLKLVKLKSSLRKLYGRHHDLVDRYGISVSQITTDMFHLSQTLSGPFLIHDLSLGL
jgi:hypothetical protein